MVTSIEEHGHDASDYKAGRSFEQIKYDLAQSPTQAKKPADFIVTLI
jgi:hypothetical protein